MKTFLLIFFGGGFGSVIRYGISHWLNNHSNSIPYGTLAVNCIGSLLIGLLLGYSFKSQALSNNQLAFFVIGFCGGFTTFSTFTYENAMFLKSGDFLHFFSYTLSSLFLGMISVFIGLWLIKFF